MTTIYAKSNILKHAVYSHKEDFCVYGLCCVVWCEMVSKPLIARKFATYVTIWQYYVGHTSSGMLNTTSTDLSKVCCSYVAPRRYCIECTLYTRSINVENVSRCCATYLCSYTMKVTSKMKMTSTSKMNTPYDEDNLESFESKPKAAPKVKTPKLMQSKN